MAKLTSLSTRSKNPKRTRLAEDSNRTLTLPTVPDHDPTDVYVHTAVLDHRADSADDDLGIVPVDEEVGSGSTAEVDYAALLSAFHPDGGTCFRVFGSGGNANVTALDRALEMGNDGGNVFFLPNLGGQSKSEITLITALWVDVDAKDHPELQDSNGVLLFPEWHLPPSVVVRSGSGGYHAYWLLNTPIDVADTDQGAAWFKQAQHTIAAVYGGDFAVCDLPRVMRLPGTINRKNGNPCTLELLKPDRRYTADEILDGLPVVAGKPGAKNSKSRTQYAVPPAVAIASSDQYPVKVIKDFTIPYLNRIKEPANLRPDLQGKEVKRVIQHLNRHLAALSLVQEGSRNSTLHSTAVHLLSCIEGLTGYGDLFKADIKQRLIEQLQEVGELIGLDSEEVLTTIGSALASEVAQQATFIGRSDRVADIKWLINNLLYPGYDRVVWRNSMDSHDYILDRRVDKDVITKIKEVAVWYVGERAFMRDSVRDAIEEMALDNVVNPFEEYLTRLPRATGTAIKRIVDHYNLSTAGEAALRYGLHQAVGGILGGTNQPLEVMPILCGGQRKGKTTLLRSLFSLSPLLQPVEGQFPDQKDKDTLLAAFQASALIVDECADILRSRNVESAKSMMSRRVFVIRMPHDRETLTFTRNFTIWGTSNKNDFLSDETGNRRFLPIDFSNAPTIGAGTATLDIAAIRDDVWAEAVAGWKQNPTNRPPDNVQAQMDRAAITHRATPEGFELVEELITEEQSIVDAIRSKGGSYHGIKATDIQARIRSKYGTQITSKQIGRCLSFLGWESKHTMKGNRWFPPIG